MNMKGPWGPPGVVGVSTAKFRNRVPTQVQRCLPLYLIIVIFLFVMHFMHNTTVDSHRGAPPPPPKLPGHTFPQKIWQTWKIDPLDFEERDSIVARTWIDKNPAMRYEVLTDANEMNYIEEKFGPNGFDRPDIIEFYRAVNLPIIKADMLRYMIMYADGGVYADIDVEALKPFHRFFPPQYNEEDYDIVVGVEIDEPSWKDHPILGGKSKSFCQWTLISRPEQPVFLKLVENIMVWFSDVARKEGVGISEVELDFDQVISGTGPSAFTEAMIADINSRGYFANWDTFHDMDESKIVGRILVHDVEAFAAGQGHSNSGNHESRGALIKHHYHASNWPSRHPRYWHAAYGQVEDCNWNRECIETWDRNVAEFEKLSEDDQNRIIAEKEAERNPPPPPEEPKPEEPKPEAPKPEQEKPSEGEDAKPKEGEEKKPKEEAKPAEKDAEEKKDDEEKKKWSEQLSEDAEKKEAEKERAAEEKKQEEKKAEDSKEEEKQQEAKKEEEKKG
jgi:mannosyltransferase OCH1-like enzyme